MLGLFVILLCLTSTWIHGEEYRTRIIFRRALKSERIIAEKVTTLTELAGISSLFLDKSMLIKEIVESPARFLIITFPQKWSKSVNLDMMRRFLHVEDVVRNISISRKLFLENIAVYFEKKKPIVGHLKKSFLITQDAEFMKKHFLKHPVVYVNFTNLVAKDLQDDIKTTLKRLKGTISKTYRGFSNVYVWLREKIKNSNGTEKQKAEEMYAKFRTFYLNEKSDIHTIRMSIRFLIKVVSDYYRKKVFVMFDEYDEPIVSMYRKPDYNNPEHKDIVMLYKGLVHFTFVNNNRIKKGILSGIYNLKEFDFTKDEKDVVWYSMLDNPLAPYYGYTRIDVDLLATALKMDEFILEKGHSWHEEYVIPPYYNTSFYHPAIMADFLNSGGVLGGTYLGKDILDDMMHLIRYRPILDVVQQLVNEEDVFMKLDSIRFGSDELWHLQKLLYIKKFSDESSDSEDMEPEEPNVDVFLGFLFMNGFTTLRRDELPLPENATHAVVRLATLQIRMKLSKHAAFCLESTCLKNYPPMDQAARHFEEFMMTKMRKRCQTQFEKSMTNLLKEAPKKCKIGSSHERFENFIEYGHKLMEILPMEIQRIREWQVKVFTNRKLKAEFVIFDPKARHVAVTEVTFNERNAISALRRAKSHAKVVERFGRLKSVKFIGINFVFKSKTVNTTAEYVEKEVATTPIQEIENSYDDANETYDGGASYDYEMQAKSGETDDEMKKGHAITIAHEILDDTDFKYARKIIEENEDSSEEDKDVIWGR